MFMYNATKLNLDEDKRRDSIGGHVANDFESYAYLSFFSDINENNNKQHKKDTRHTFKIIKFMFDFFLKYEL